MRGIAHIVACAVVCGALTAAPPVGAAEEGTAPDTAAVGAWQGLYRARIHLSEHSDRFPWNDPVAETHSNDRVALMGLWRPGGGFELFAKGATGKSLGWIDGPRSNFAVEQAHLSYAYRARFEGRLFAYERAFGSPNRLLQLVSNDSPIVSQGGEGLDASFGIAGPVSLRYTGAGFKEQRDGSGMPSSGGGGDFLNIISIQAEAGIWSAALLLSDTRSQDFGDAVLAGLGFGIPLGQTRLVAELARSVEGSWTDLRDMKLFDADFDRMIAGEISRWLSPEVSMGAELLGLEASAKRYGRFGIVPGYRYAGSGFANAGGEAVPGTVESYLTAWWRHPRLAALLTVNAADRYVASEERSGGVLAATFDTRFRDGVETRGTALLREGYRGVFIVSVIDDNALSRVSATARVDDAGDGNDLSFLAEAAVNIGRKFTLGGTLLLESSARGYYSADLEMRSGRRFFARASFGSYVPASEYVQLNYGPSATAVEGELFMSFHARVSLGGL